MAKAMQSMDELFKGRHFEREIIILCVRCYLCCKLSLRDLVEMMAESDCDFRTRRSCAGFSATCGSSRSAGIGSHGRQGGRGESMRPTSRSTVHGLTCIGSSIARAKPLTSS